MDSEYINTIFTLFIIFLIVEPNLAFVWIKTLTCCNWRSKEGKDKKKDKKHKKDKYLDNNNGYNPD